MDGIEKLLQSLKERRTKRRYGIGLKSSYIADLDHCFRGGHCPSKLFRNTPSGDALAKLLKDAEQQLTYCNKRMVVDGYKASSDGSPEGSILDIEFVATSKKQDRDGDILEPNGAVLDEKMPLLWQHIPFEPVGPVRGVVDRNRSKIKLAASILNTELGRDAATLVKGGALRISHGFMPLEWEPREDKDGNIVGWHIKKYEMMEASLVSIPSNTDAVITAFSQAKLHHPAVKGWAENLYSKRRKLAPVAIDLSALPPGTKIKIGGEEKSEPTPAACSCDKSHQDLEEKGVVSYSATEPAPKNRAWDADGAVKRLREWAGGEDKIDWKKYQRGFAYVEGDGGKFGAYKLPHHDIIDGKLAVVWKGVVAAYAAADGSRGGMSLSDSDNAGVKAHLAKHYKQFDETPPDEKKDDDDKNTPATPAEESVEALMSRTLQRIAVEGVSLDKFEKFASDCGSLLKAARERQAAEVLLSLCAN